jgi:1-acyl-sn-glycerol-3-phosphate acyltransferase
MHTFIYQQIVTNLIHSAVTHHNMLLDPAVICNAYSDQYLHYWAKSSIFAGEYATRFLKSTGCVPVDRNNADDRQNLYKATMDVLKLHESLVIFPEGTSHSLPRLSKLKDGASFVSFNLIMRHFFFRRK